MARHIVMDPSGHSSFQFDKNNTSSLAEAERRYNELMGKGYMPAEVKGGGTHHVPKPRQRSFDPDADETIFIPALKGG